MKNHTTAHTADDLLIKYVYIILLFQRKNEYSYTVGEGLRALPQTTKTWEYNDSTWSDLLTNYNGTPITYDEIGNPLNIGSKSLTWTGRQLQSITDGDSEISYTYNGDGLRTSKTVNGTKTEYYYNGSILAGQKTGNDTLVFMYDNNSDIFGFIYNDTEYYYIKNAQNDVIAIADADGNVLIKYTYDAWGKVVSITDASGNDLTELFSTVGGGVLDAPSNTAEPTTVDESVPLITVAPQTAQIANLNPILYRSYYYDKETEWYYLHSRYYNPEWGRFINAEDFNYLNTKNRFNLNAYMYSWNSPIVFEASKGTEPQISININDILSFIKSSAEKIKNGLTAEYDRISKLFNNWSNAVHARCKAIADKISYFFKYPEAVLNTMFSATSKVMSSVGSAVRFGLIEFIRSNITSKLIEVKDEETDSENTNASASLMRSKSSSSKEDHDSILMAIFQGLFAAIELDWINEILEFFGSSLNKLAEKTYEAVERISLLFITTFNVVFDYLINVFSLDALSIVDSIVLEKGEEMALTSGSNLIDAKGIGKGFGAFISIFNFFLNIDSAGSGAFTKLEDNIMNVVTLVIDIACLFVGPVAGMLIPLISNFIMDVSALRIKGLVFMY